MMNKLTHTQYQFLRLLDIQTLAVKSDFEVLETVSAVEPIANPSPNNNAEPSISQLSILANDSQANDSMANDSQSQSDEQPTGFLANAVALDLDNQDSLTLDIKQALQATTLQIWLNPTLEHPVVWQSQQLFIRDFSELMAPKFKQQLWQWIWQSTLH